MYDYYFKLLSLTAVNLKTKDAKLPILFYCIKYLKNLRHFFKQYDVDIML